VHLLVIGQNNMENYVVSIVEIVAYRNTGQGRFIALMFCHYK
jgi:hypothetical protein